jgi:hypothetical protein
VGLTLRVKVPASDKNIRLGWKGLPGPNTVAYCKLALIPNVKSFITLAPTLVYCGAELIMTTRSFIAEVAIS